MVSCTAYLPIADDLSAVTDVAIECEFPLNDVNESVINAAEGALLRMTYSRMIRQFNKLNPPEGAAISMCEVDRLIVAGRQGPFSAKSNGIHMRTWPDRTGLLFMRVGGLGTEWALAR